LRFAELPLRSENRVGRHIVAAILLCAPLSGCLVLPVPVPTAAGPHASSRTNVGASVPESMVVGQTTRTQVLLALGEPDGHAADDSWFVYGAVERRGGLRWALVVAVGAGYGGGAGGAWPLDSWDSSRRLTIRFNENGIVSGASVEQRNCNASDRGSCLDVAGGDISASDDAARNAQLRATAGSVIAAYNVVHIVPVPAQSRCEFSWRAASNEIEAGPLEIRERALYWRSTDAHGHETWTELALGDIRAVRPLERHVVWRIPVEKRDGSCVLLTVLRHHERPPQEFEAEVRTVIAGRIEALSGEAASGPSSAPK
jgi:hypothetical protein